AAHALAAAAAGPAAGAGGTGPRRSRPTRRSRRSGRPAPRAIAAVADRDPPADDHPAAGTPASRSTPRHRRAQMVVDSGSPLDERDGVRPRGCATAARLGPGTYGRRPLGCRGRGLLWSSHAPVSVLV